MINALNMICGLFMSFDGLQFERFETVGKKFRFETSRDNYHPRAVHLACTMRHCKVARNAG